MEDKYNDKLGDFFRKKFSDTDGTDESWGRPDEKVREDILNKISTPVHAPLHSSNLFWKKVALLALLLAGGYIYFLHQKNIETENLLQAKIKHSEKKEVELNNLKASNSALILEKEKISNKNEELILQNKNLIDVVNQEKSTVTQLSFENKALKNQIKSNSIIEEGGEILKEETAPTIIADTEEKVRKNSLADIIQKIYPLVLEQHLAQKTEPKKNIELDIIDEESNLEIVEDIEPIKPKTSKYEVGYEYGLTSFEIPIERKFALQRAANQNIQDNKVNINFHGAAFAFALKNNLWIRTGFRRAAFSLEREYKIALDYNKQNEIDRPGQGTSNQLLLTTSTPYSTTRSTFEITFDQGDELTDGDLLELTITDAQKLTYVQVPLGLEYFYGTEKLKGMIRGGIQWNKVAIEDYTFSVYSEAKEKEIPVDRRRVIAKDIPSDKFISTFFGLGLDYQLLNHFHARASFVLNHNLNKNNNRIKRFSNSTETGTALNLGLNYRF